MNIVVSIKIESNREKKADAITFKIDFAIAISVEYVDDTLNQWILLQFRNRHELLNTQRSTSIDI